MLIPTAFQVPVLFVVLLLFFIHKRTASPMVSLLSPPLAERADTERFALQSRVLRCCLPPTAASARPLTSASGRCNSRETYSSCRCPRAHSDLKEEETTHAGCGFGWCFRVPQKGGDRAGGELVTRQPVALLMPSPSSVAGSDTGAGAWEETESSNWG